MYFRKIVFLFNLFVFLLESCEKNASIENNASVTTGKGGSLARFTISGNYLYLADFSTLRVFDISDPSNTVEKPSVSVGFGVETIFPYKDKLFIGSTNGMYIYSLATPAAPVKLGNITHVRSCDPVVANDTVSYSTLRGNTPCGPAESGLYIYDIKTITVPVLKKIMPLSTPYGLGLVDSIIFVCQGSNGLSSINVKDPSDPKMMYTKNDAVYMDVIPHDNLLICYVSTGILIYDATDLRNIVEVGNVNY